MSEQDEVRRRLDRQDERIFLADRTAAYALHLAAHADRDTAELLDVQRGHTRVLSALRETQAEQGAEIHELRIELRTEVGDVRSDIAKLNTDVNTLKTDVSTLKTDVSTLKTDVSTLKDGVTELLRRTA